MRRIKKIEFKRCSKKHYTTQSYIFCEVLEEFYHIIYADGKILTCHTRLELPKKVKRFFKSSWKYKYERRTFTYVVGDSLMYETIEYTFSEPI